MLIDKEFIEAFVKKGDVFVISHGTRIDSEDCVALLPSGHLLLHLTKDTYEQLGLEGKPSIYGGKRPGKYVVEIDLTQPYFTPLKKNYQRVKRCLEENFPLCFSFLVMWIPKDSSVCSSSIAVYFEKKGFDYKQLNLKQTWKTHKNIEVPVIDSCQTETQEECCGVTDLYEWLGYISCNCNIPGGSEEYLSSYVCPAPASTHAQCVCYRIEGMLSTTTILTVLQGIREHIKSCSVPWAALTAHGFADSPVSWQRREHGFQASGENLFTFVVFQNDDYWLFSAVDAADICP
ncbi:ribonuclease P protein subunit p40-like [Liolophura sinensis]|uniref:ribonuclease P protein subunit p40-like n=1 Tax=Liolophura sinensis TaxID=3198878 RepID=UPI0031583F8B